MTVDEAASEIHYILTGAFPGESPEPKKIPMRTRPIFSCDCGATEPKEFGTGNRRKCKKCLSEEAKERYALSKAEKLKVVQTTEMELKICKTCGAQFEPWKNGCVPMGICRACKDKSIIQGQQKSKYGMTLKRPSVLELDFRDDQDLMEQIGTLAKSQRRTLQQQVFFLLEKALKTD